MPLKSSVFKNGHQLDDSLLWLQLKEGDRSGLEGLYLKFSNDLFRYGMAIVANRSFVKDCIQEVFIDLWKYRSALNHTDNVKIYLIKCLSNKISKEVSKEKRVFSENEISPFETIFLEESVEDRFIESQRSEELQFKLRVGLSKLPARQREVIQLLFFEKYSYEETSKVLGINVESCYTLAWKAVKGLKKEILVRLIILFFFLAN